MKNPASLSDRVVKMNARLCSRRSEFAGEACDFYPVNNPADECPQGTKNAKKGNDAATSQDAHDQADFLARFQFFGDAALLEFSAQRFGDVDDHEEVPDKVEQRNQ